MRVKIGNWGSLCAATAFFTAGCCAPIVWPFAHVAPDEAAAEPGLPTAFPPRPRLHPVPTHPVFESAEAEKARKRIGPSIKPEPERAVKVPALHESSAESAETSVAKREIVESAGTVESEPLSTPEVKSVLVRPAGKWRARTK